MTNKERVPDFRATPRVNKKTGQKTLTIPKPIRHKYDADREYNVYLEEIDEVENQ